MGDLPWGSHFCMFYHDRQELLSILIPYIKAGVEGNEACVWIVSGLLSVGEARGALAHEMPDLTERMQSGQVEIIDASEWYTRGGVFDSETVLRGWLGKATVAESKGFAGLRATGDTSWLQKEQWGKFTEYELEIGSTISRRKIMALCSYSLSIWEAHQVIDVVSTHEFSLIKVGGEWKQIENSERRKAYEKALSSEEKYRRAVENIRVALYSALPDEKSTTILLTDRIKDITGYSADDFLSRPELFGEIVHPDDRDRVWASLAEQRANHAPLSTEYRIVTKSGETRWVKDEAVPAFDEQGNMIRIDGFMEDISERKSLIEALGRSEERYKLAQKAAMTGSWDWNIATGELEWSDEIEPIFGFGKGKFGRTYDAFIECVHPDDRDVVASAVNATLREDRPYDIEHRIVWPDGAVHWMSERGGVVRDRSGTPIRMLGVVRDITNEKLAEQQIMDLNEDLERRTQQLSAANKELEAFSYSVSHDLRAPLRRIDGFSSIIMEEHGKELSEEVRGLLSRIRNSVKSMDMLVEDLLRLSRLTTTGLATEKVDLGSLARNILDQLRATEPDRRVEVYIGDGAVVLGDPSLLNIALENLIGNAWKFTRKRPVARIEFGSKMIDGQATYFVRDNGVGFDMAQIDKVFEPFRRLHSDSEYPGSGIGLAVVSRVISRHNGRLWAEAELDKGATFYFTLESRS